MSQEQRVKHICNVWMSCHGATLQGPEWLCLQEQELREITRWTEEEIRGSCWVGDADEDDELLQEGNDLHLKNLHEQHPDLIPETYLSASRHIRRFLVSNSGAVASRWEKSITSCITHTSWDGGEDLWVSHNWDAPCCCRCGLTPLYGCEERKSWWAASVSIFYNQIRLNTSTIQTQVSLCSLFSCPACHISTFRHGSMCHIQTHQSLTCEYQMTDTHRVMHSPFSVILPLKWLHAGRWSVGPGWLLWAENRCSCRQRRRNVSPACRIKKSTSNVLFTCSYIITPVTHKSFFVRIFWFALFVI